MPRRSQTKKESPEESSASGSVEGENKLTAETLKLIDSSIFSANTLVNMSIYAILELPQELYFGSHSEKNLNILEKVEMRAEVKSGDKVEPVLVVKGYYSPTKQRGIERRAIAYSLVKVKQDNTEKLMPYYKYFNLSIDVTNTYPGGVPDPRDILTFLWGASWREPAAYIRGRVGYGGGVAIQDDIFIKQRNRVPYETYTKTEKEEREEVAEQTLWKKEYNEPGVLIPVVRHGFMLGWENYEPHALAYAFLEGLKLAGAGTPKSLDIFDGYWLSNEHKHRAVVVDLYLWLSPEPVVISPLITSVTEALEEFKRKALNHSQDGIIEDENQLNIDDIIKNVKEGKAIRLVGNVAYKFLRKLAGSFGSDYLGKIEKLNIPRVEMLQDMLSKAG